MVGLYVKEVYMKRFIADQENYKQTDEAVLAKLLDAYYDLYSQACTNGNYILCQNLKMEIGNLILGEPTRIKLEDKLFIL